MNEPTYVKVNHQMVQTIGFNREILGITSRTPALQPAEEFKLSLVQLREEIDEMEQAFKKGDFLSVLDALIDLEYFLYGVYWKNGIDEQLHEQLFTAVHDANMMKKRGVKKGREGFDAADATKPDAWTDPMLKFARILDNS